MTADLRVAAAVRRAITAITPHRRRLPRKAGLQGPRNYKITIWLKPSRYEQLTEEMLAEGFRGTLTKYIEHRLDAPPRR